MMIVPMESLVFHWCTFISIVLFGLLAVSFYHGHGSHSFTIDDSVFLLVQTFMLNFDFFRCRKSVNDCVGALVIYVTDVSEWKRWMTQRTVLIIADSVVFIVQTFNWFVFFSPSNPFMTIDQRASPYDLRRCGCFDNYPPIVSVSNCQYCRYV